MVSSIHKMHVKQTLIEVRSFPIYLNFTSKAKELDAYTESHVGTDAVIDNDSILASKDIEATRTEKY
jgi:FHS family L-fucose permease-like MFS transporter